MKFASSLALALLLVSPASHADTILSQNFETGSPPPGWSRTQSTPSVGWEFGTALGSAYFAIPAHGRYAASNDDAAGGANVADQDRLITPILDLSGYSGQTVVLSFAYVQPGTYSSTGHIEVSVDNGQWAPLMNVTFSPQWTTTQILLNPYIGLTNVRLAFRHNDHGQWADGFAVDDVLVESRVARDAAMQGLAMPTHVTPGIRPVVVEVQNAGETAITSLGFSYSVNGGTPILGTATSLNIQPGQAVMVAHPTSANFALGNHSIALAVTSVNASTDLNAANNTATDTLKVLSQIPPKRVVLEQHTGTWGQFCPDGTVVYQQVSALDPAVIPVSIHNGDAMSIANGGVIQSVWIDAYPSGTIDRMPFAGTVRQLRGEWLTRVGERLDDLVSASIALQAISFNSASRTLSVTANAQFFGSEAGDLRMNVWVVEDGVVGFPQTNFYNSVIGHPFFGMGDPVVGFVHDGVVREMLGGAWGSAGEIPTTVIAGNSFSKSYQYVLPQNVAATRVRLIGVLQRFDADISKREIINAVELDFAPFADVVFKNSFD